MLYITGGNVKEGKASELQEWIQENDEALAANAPDGWTFRGHYFTVHNIGPFDAAVMWEIEKYGDLDIDREHDNETYVELVKEAQDFLTEGSGQTILLRAAGDTRIVEPE